MSLIEPFPSAGPDQAPLERVLFLDVDGVLNRCEQSGFGLERDKLDRLKVIVDECDPHVIVTSTWRMFEPKLRRLVAELLEMNARFAGCTPVAPPPEGGGLRIIHGQVRGQEIHAWIEKHGRPKTFVILDDDRDTAPYREHQVRTWCYGGLTDDHVEDVIWRFQTNQPDSE